MLFAVLLVLIVCVTIFFGSTSKQGATSGVLQSAFAGISLQLDRFLNQSAQQMMNPLYGVSLNDQDKATICTGDQDKSFNCYETYYRGVVKNSGIEAAFADLKIRYNNTSYVKTMCHSLAHIIGQAAVDKYPEVSQAYLHGDNFCWSGYYHGVIEGVAFNIGKEKLFTSLNTICANIPGKQTYSFDYYNCVHGLGHGLMEVTYDELFDSLSLCDKLTGSWEQQSCYGGVFMENIIVDTKENQDHSTKYLKPNQPMYPCIEVADVYKGACYLMQTSYMLKVTDGNFMKVFELCAGAGQAFAPTCYQSLGRDASGRSVSDARITKDICNLGKTYEQKSNCIIGAVKDFISYYHSDVQAKELCASIDTGSQGVCSQTVESYYKTFQ